MHSTRAPLVLLVSASADGRHLSQVLGEAGYEVLHVDTARDALEEAQARPPDIALLDMATPDMGGVALCRSLLDLPGLAELPVIFVTAAGDRQRLVEAFNAGAVDYIAQPFFSAELLVRVRTHLELKQARDRLSTMLRERREVTDVVAHDIKNPLSSIRFAAQMLLQSKELPVPREEITRDIQQCAEEALRFIQRFLARGADGQRLRQFMAQRLQLAGLAREAMQLLQAAASSRSVQLVLDGDAAVAADHLAARNVLHNLLSNAIRHSPEGEQIDIQIGTVRPGYARCRVLDRGPGISEEDRGRLFRRYVHFAAARERNGEAREAQTDEFPSGLGLAIAKHDVAQMGGHLWYEPRPGGGSVFGFDLPQQATRRDHEAP